MNFFMRSAKEIVLTRKQLQRKLELQDLRLKEIDLRLKELETLVDKLELERLLVNLSGRVALLNSLIFPPEDQDDWF